MASKAKLVTRSASSTSVTSDNLGKGTELTFAEMDSNLINLRDQTFGLAADDSATIQVASGDTLYIRGGAGISTATNSSGELTITSNFLSSSLGSFEFGADGVISNTVTNQGIKMAPNGTGDFMIDSHSIRVGDEDAAVEIASNGTQDFKIKVGDISDSHIVLNGNSNITLTAASNKDIDVSLGGSGTIDVDGGSGINVDTQIVVHGLLLKDTEISSTASNAPIEISPNGTGQIRLNEDSDITGALTVSSTLGVTGASTLDGVSISDNHISSAASNADLHIDTSGTGKVITNAVQVGVGDSLGGNIILTDQASGNFKTSDFETVGMLNPTGLQIDATGSFHYPSIVLNSYSTNANTALWATRSRSNSFGTDAHLQQGDVIFQFFGSGFREGASAGQEYYTGNTIVDLYASENHDASNRGGGFRIKTINTGAVSGATEKFTTEDNVTIKNPKAATTAALAVEGSIRLKNTSNPSNVTDSAHIFAKDDGSTSEVYVRDEAGNETKISPHDQSGQWEYYSKNINTGKVFRVNMEKMIRKLEDITGESFIEQE